MNEWSAPIHWRTSSEGVAFPCIDLVAAPRIEGLTIENGWRLCALIDTGADHSFMPTTLASEMSPSIARLSTSHGISGLVTTRFYNLSVVLNSIPIVFDTEVSSSDYEAFFNVFRFVVGRDILNAGVLRLSRSGTSQFSISRALTV